MLLFPFYENIENMRFLIVGGGQTAKQKLSVLLPFTNRITVIAPETDITGVRVIQRSFCPEDIALGDVIIAATGDRSVNQEISERAKEAGKPVNVVDDAELCTFFFPSLIKRGGLVIGISTSGKSPAFARMMREEIQRILPEETEAVLEAMESVRPFLPALIPTQSGRASFLRNLLAELLSGERKPEEILADPEGWCRANAGEARKRQEMEDGTDSGEETAETP